MRKGQARILKRAKGLPESWLEVLRSEKYTIKQLRGLYYLFSAANTAEGDYSELVEMAVEMPKVAYFIAICISHYKFDTDTIKALIDMPFVKARFYVEMLLRGRTMEECDELCLYVENNKPEYFEDFEALYRSAFFAQSYFPIKEIIEWDRVFSLAEGQSRRDMEVAMQSGLSVKEYVRFIKEHPAPRYYFASDMRCFKTAPHLYEIRGLGFDSSFTKKMTRISREMRSVVSRKTDVVVNIPHSERDVDLRDKSIIVTFERYPGFHINGMKGRPFRVEKLVIFYDSMCILKEMNNKGPKKLVPLSLKDMSTIIKIHGVLAKDLFIAYFKDIKNQYIGKDLIREIRDKSRLPLPPIPINEAIKYFSIPALMKGYYRTSGGVNFKKMGIRRGYFFMKCRGYLNPTSVSVLSNILSDNEATKKHLRNCGSLKHAYLGRNLCVLVNEFLQSVVKSRIESTHGYIEDDIDVIVSDYIHVMSEEKNVSLKHTSIRKLIDEHVDVTIRRDLSGTPKIKIPKGTKFKNLREMLPEEFRWIKTKRDIIAEGREMRHCVASYANLVNRDECAIYHFEYNHVPYTVEFRMGKDGYYVNQIQTVADRGYDVKAKEYIQKLIS